MSTPTTRTDSSMSPEESLKFVEAGMNLAGHVITDPHLQEILRQLAHHEISFEEYDAATTRHIMGDA
jgi:riboflavin synthase, alpha subunit